MSLLTAWMTMLGYSRTSRSDPSLLLQHRLLTHTHTHTHTHTIIIALERNRDGKEWTHAMKCSSHLSSTLRRPLPSSTPSAKALVSDCCNTASTPANWPSTSAAILGSCMLYMWCACVREESAEPPIHTRSSFTRIIIMHNR